VTLNGRLGLWSGYCLLALVLMPHDLEAQEVRIDDPMQVPSIERALAFSLMTQDALQSELVELETAKFKGYVEYLRGMSKEYREQEVRQEQKIKDVQDEILSFQDAAAEMGLPARLSDDWVAEIEAKQSSLKIALAGKKARQQLLIEKAKEKTKQNQDVFARELSLCQQIMDVEKKRLNAVERLAEKNLARSTAIAEQKQAVLAAELEWAKLQRLSQSPAGGSLADELESVSLDIAELFAQVEAIESQLNAYRKGERKLRQLNGLIRNQLPIQQKRYIDRVQQAQASTDLYERAIYVQKMLLAAYEKKDAAQPKEAESQPKEAESQPKESAKESAK